MNFTRTIRRLLKRGIEGAGAGPRGVLIPSLAAPRQQLEARRNILGARAAAIVANTTAGSAIINFIVTSAVQNGFTARSRHPNRAVASALEDGFSRWQDEAVLEGNMDLPSFVALLLRTIAVQGEAIVRDVV